MVTDVLILVLSRELQQRKLGLWWDMAAQGGKSESASAQDAQGGSARGAATDKSEVQEHVCPAHGLFPSPMAATCSPADRKKKIEAFQVSTRARTRGGQMG